MSTDIVFLHIALTASTVTATGLGVISLGLWLNYKEKFQESQQHAETIKGCRESLEYKGKLIDELYDERRELRKELAEKTEKLSRIQAVFEVEGDEE